WRVRGVALVAGVGLLALVALVGLPTIGFDPGDVALVVGRVDDGRAVRLRCADVRECWVHREDDERAARENHGEPASAEELGVHGRLPSLRGPACPTLHPG